MSNFNPLCLADRKILVTGASSGLGRASSIYLSKLGAKLVLVARNEERLNDTLSKLEGVGHIIIAQDLAELEDMTEIFDKAIEDGIKLNGLVHCAGIMQALPLKMLTREKINEAMTINYYSFIELVRQYSKKKYNNGGSIVGISSVAADKASQCQTNYAASKAAMDIAAQALSIELAKKSIRINTILPGFIATEMVANWRDILGTSNKENQQSIGTGAPDDVASAVAFLISDMSRFTSGRKLFVDGRRFL